MTENQKRTKRCKNKYEGEIFPTKRSGNLRIVKYIKSNEVLVEFVSTKYRATTTMNRINNGRVKDPYYPIIFGFGYFGEGEYTAIDRKTNLISKCYISWTEMIKRAYSKEHKKTLPTYDRCTIHKEWGNYQIFSEWYYQNLPKTKIDNQKYDLDKDLLSNKIKTYSPKTCCLLPHCINVAMTTKSGGKYKYSGVRPEHKKFIALITKRNKPYRLGLSNTEDEAYEIYKMAKESYIRELAAEYRDYILPNAYDALLNFKVD